MQKDAKHIRILLNIKSEYLRKYLEFLFKKEGDIFILDRNCDFGKYCFLNILKSEIPLKIEKTEQTVTIEIPKSKNIDRIDEKYYLYYDNFAEQKLNDLLKVISNIDFREYCISMREIKIKQKDIINSYLISRKLILEKDLTDMIKKRFQRNSEKNVISLQKMLLYKLQNAIKLQNKNISNSISGV
ncbi:MAG: hypothetical protein LBS50_09365 [Prevotellaceae bacterium]|nr:hypothetical protein [Prevotellaceae bacterium]